MLLNNRQVIRGTAFCGGGGDGGGIGDSDGGGGGGGGIGDSVGDGGGGGGDGGGIGGDSTGRAMNKGLCTVVKTISVTRQ